MSAKFKETSEGEVSVCIRDITNDNFAIAMFLQKIYFNTVNLYLRERTGLALAKVSNRMARRSHWIQYVILPRAIAASVDSRADDRLFDMRNIAPLADRLHGLIVGGREEDVLNIVLIGRGLHVRISPDKENLILSFQERPGEIDSILKKAMKEVLSKPSL